MKGADDIPVLLDSALSAAWSLHTESIPPKPLRLFSDIPLDAPGCQIWRYCLDRHRGAINGSFLDGSSQKILLQDLWNLKWHRKFYKAGFWTRAGGAEPEDWPKWMRGFKDY
jgi:prepilin-type processing-associated H-X9-DG protein